MSAIERSHPESLTGIGSAEPDMPSECAAGDHFSPAPGVPHLPTPQRTREPEPVAGLGQSHTADSERAADGNDRGMRRLAARLRRRPRRVREGGAQ